MTERRSGGRVGQTAAIYIAVGVLQRSLSLLLLPFITRLVSPAEYGVISVVVTTVALVGIIFASASEALLFRALARAGETGQPVVRWSRNYLVWLLPATCMVAAMMLLVLGDEIPYVEVWAIELAAAGLVSALTGYALPIARAEDQLWRYVILAVTWMVVSSASKLVLMSSVVPGPLGWALGDLAGGVVAWLLVVCLTRQPLLSGRNDSDAVMPESVSQFVGFLLPLVPHRLSFWALTSLSRPLLAIVASDADVGIFSLAMSISLVASTLLAELNRAVMLEYSRETLPAPTDHTRAIARVQFVFALCVPAGVGALIALAAPVAVASDFSPAVPIAGLMLVGQFVYGVYLIPMNYLVQTAGKFNTSSIAATSGTLVSVFGTLLFGAQGNLVGVALSTVAGYLVMALVAFLLVYLASVRVYWRQIFPGWPATILGSLGLAISVAVLSLYPAGTVLGVCSLLLPSLTCAWAVRPLLSARRGR